jgi:hypothetical protein
MEKDRGGLVWLEREIIVLDSISEKVEFIYVDKKF